MGARASLKKVIQAFPEVIAHVVVLEVLGNRGIVQAKKLFTSFLVASLLFVTNSSGGAIAAGDTQGPPPESAYVTDQQAHLDQVRELAKTLEMSESDVEIRLANEAKYTEIVDLAQAKYSTTFAGSGVSDDLASQVWIRFVGAAPAEIASMASKSGIAVNIQTDAKFSLSAIIAHQNRLTAALSVAGVSTFMVEIRQKPNVDLALGVSVKGEVGIQQAASKAISKFLALRTSIVGLSVVQEHVDFSSGTTAITGGGSLIGPGGSCTAAFTVNKGNLAGVATANHCSPIGTSIYYQNNLSYFYAGNANPADGDAAWYLFPNTTSITNKIIFNNSGSVMNITSSGNPAAGTSVCRYGLTTNYNCGTVSSSSMCVNFGQPIGTVCNLAGITPGTDAKGDSGGPVFSGNRAVGTTTGYITISGAQVDVFTKISSLGLLGLTVRTVP